MSKKKAAFERPTQYAMKAHYSDRTVIDLTLIKCAQYTLSGLNCKHLTALNPVGNLICKTGDFRRKSPGLMRCILPILPALGDYLVDDVAWGYGVVGELDGG